MPGPARPDIHADIDWAQEVLCLEQEFRPLAPESEASLIRCDKLLRVSLKRDQQIRLLHIEAQCQNHPEFPRRMCDYNHRSTQHYRETVLSLAILGDDNPDWVPREFYRSGWGCRSGIDFRPIKLLDWASRQDELEQHENPVGLIVLAHLKALETRLDPVARRAWRLRLWRAIRQRENLDHEDRQRLTAIIERFIDLPANIEAELRQEFLQETEGENVPYVTAFERIAREEGREEGLRLGIRTIVELRFGEPDAAFLALLDAADLPQLEQAMTRVKAIQSLGELFTLLQSGGDPA